ncbi:TPA: hypothetical protein DEP21_01935 [Patescibacteria group bacterium]|nr:hypothetical protein [Candidatus Gracilibacteria bacterium]
MKKNTYEGKILIEFYEKETLSLERLKALFNGFPVHIEMFTEENNRKYFSVLLENRKAQQVTGGFYIYNEENFIFFFRYTQIKGVYDALNSQLLWQHWNKEKKDLMVLE